MDDELKKMRNPLLMTARQRALLDKRSGDDSLESFPAEPLLALPSGQPRAVLVFGNVELKKPGGNVLI